MADRRFFRVSGPFTLEQLAKFSGATLSGAKGEGAARRFADVAPLERAGPEDVSFLDNRKYLDSFEKSRAGVCCVAPDHAARAPAGMALLITDQPYKAYALIAQAFYPAPPEAAPILGEEEGEGVSHPDASIDPASRLGKGVVVAARAVIGAGAEIGAGSRIGPGAVIGPGVVLGENCRIGAQASLECCILGDRVAVYPGARIGQDGFGYAIDDGGPVKVPQLGRVMIGDDCEIGANTCIDRGSGPDTVIGRGCIIDNLVQIGHNVVLGDGCIVVAQVGISGSTKVGNYVVMGGKVGVAGHLRIGDGVQIAARAGVTKDIPAGATVGGFPAVPIRQWHRQVAVLARLAAQKAKK